MLKFNNPEALKASEILPGYIIQAKPGSNATYFPDNYMPSFRPITTSPTGVYAIVRGKLNSDFYLEDDDELPLFRKDATLVQVVTNGFVRTLESFSTDGLYEKVGLCITDQPIKDSFSPYMTKDSKDFNQQTFDYCATELLSPFRKKLKKIA